MDFKHIIYEKKGRIAYITINRPEVLNALHPPAHAELWTAWSDFRDDPEIWVAILTGTGERAFSTGRDLKYQAEHSGDARAALAKDPGGFGDATHRIECYKPMIAAVNGFALGGGLDMALACDIIIAADHAKLGLPEPKVGLMAGAGGVHRLPRQVPLKLAMGMILSARLISAQEAYRIGLVNEVVPLKDLMSTANQWAEDILACSPLSVRASKEAIMKGIGLPLETALATSFWGQQALYESEDYIEGPKAFAEKRPPQWKGH